ncbi:hypothetical protein [Demequina sp. SO4-18]|uniref:hypothetical protein n=1 Tax=Demequina sp. SO4-18 TaxID=3401026 RepID=UPI003B5B52B3
MTPDHENFAQERPSGPDEQEVPEIEDDQTVAPRPEEEIADALRSAPDDGHGKQPE